MKEVDYENLKGDEHVFHMWEPLQFEIKENYKYINNNPIFKIASDMLFAIIVPILWILNKVLFGFRIEGKENLKGVKGGKVTISNHIHPMDCTMIGLVNFSSRTYYPTLQSNFQIPFIRHLIRILYATPIPKDPIQKERFFEQIEHAIKSGKTIHMYPEGALWPYYEGVRDFKKGAFKMAIDTNCPIVPIIYKFEEPKGIFKLYKKKKCIYAKVLKPIYPNIDLDKAERIEELMEKTIAEMKNA